MEIIQALHTYGITVIYRVYYVYEIITLKFMTQVIYNMAYMSPLRYLSYRTCTDVSRSGCHSPLGAINMHIIYVMLQCVL